MKIFENYAARYERTREEEMSVQEYLDLCKRDRMAYATAAERMLAAIGEPELLKPDEQPLLSSFALSLFSLVNFSAHLRVWRTKLVDGHESTGFGPRK